MAEIEKIDDHTIEVTTPSPNPILPRELVFLYIMDKEWSEANNATEATSPQAGDTTATYAAQNANGTGPFRVISRQADVKSVFKRFEDYWGEPRTNVTDIIFTPIGQDATRVAALISGELDLVYPVPVQDWPRLEEASGVQPLTGPEARTIFLGMDQWRDELLYSNVEGTNPLKDERVRAAMAHAINLEAINEKIMREAATPSGLMVAPQINGHNPELNTPYAYDPERSKALLAEAGYPDGFELGMDCPNNRYVNDEKICQAVVGLLARVGIRVDLNAQPKSKYFAKVSPQNGNDTSFYLLGWTPGTIDSHNVMFNLLSSFDTEENTGQFNYGRYSNERVDELTEMVGDDRRGVPYRAGGIRLPAAASAAAVLGHPRGGRGRAAPRQRARLPQCRPALTRPPPSRPARPARCGRDGTPPAPEPAPPPVGIADPWSSS
jgi:peptide/nickel transport system substrate-binding protein